MKKAIKNYLAKLQENDKKGFSLVELIIVMAIMAILVGIVASQVLPYMEKSRQSKDQQLLSSLVTDMVSAIAQADKAVVDFSGELNTISIASGGDWSTVLGGLRSNDGSSVVSVADIESSIAANLKSKAATDSNKGNSKIYVSYSSTDGEVCVWIPVSSSDDTYASALDKLKVSSLKS